MIIATKHNSTAFTSRTNIRRNVAKNNYLRRPTFILSNYLLDDEGNPLLDDEGNPLLDDT